MIRWDILTCVPCPVLERSVFLFRVLAVFSLGCGFWWDCKGEQGRRCFWLPSFYLRINTPPVRQRPGRFLLPGWAVEDHLHPGDRWSCTLDPLDLLAAGKVDYFVWPLDVALLHSQGNCDEGAAPVLLGTGCSACRGALLCPQESHSRSIGGLVSVLWEGQLQLNNSTRPLFCHPSASSLICHDHFGGAYHFRRGSVALCGLLFCFSKVCVALCCSVVSPAVNLRDA